MNSLLGIGFLLLVAWLLSSNRRAINLRTVGLAFTLQVLIGYVALFSDWGQAGLNIASEHIAALLGFSRAGIDFMFGGLVSVDSNLGFIFAFSVLPVVIFFSALIAVLYHIGVMHWIIRTLGGALKKILGTSHTESLSASANIFVGQAEAPLVVRPYLAGMTVSELFAIMVGGMASIAGSVMAGYAALGIPLEYLLAASFMAAPGGLLMAKLLEPETDVPVRPERGEGPERDSYVNLVDAAASGAMDGFRMAGAIAAMLIAFIGLIALVNGLLGWGGSLVGLADLSLEGLLGIIFRPLAWLLGVPWSEATMAGSLIGQKLVLNEFVAYVAYTDIADQFSPVASAIQFLRCVVLQIYRQSRFYWGV